jgi:hypothetical protein
MAKETKVNPTYFEGEKPMKIGLHDVVRALQVISDGGKTLAFVTAAKEKKAFVSVDADTVNFVKDFFAQNGLHEHPVGKHIVNAQPAAANVAGVVAAPPTKDFDCNFGTH